MPTEFWRILDDMPGVQASWIEWKMRLGAEFDRFQPYFVPLSRSAESIPTAAGTPGDFYRIITHGPDDLVGVHHRNGEVITVSRSDVIIHRLNSQRLHQGIAQALGVDFAPSRFHAFPYSHRIGVVRSVAGVPAYVYFTIPYESNDFQQVVTTVLAQNDAPCLFLAPTRRWITLDVEEMIRRRHGWFLPLNETLEASSDGSWIPSSGATQRIINWQSYLPQTVVVSSSESPVVVTAHPTHSEQGQFTVSLLVTAERRSTLSESGFMPLEKPSVTASPSPPSLRHHPVVDRSTFTVRLAGKSCFLGNTIQFQLAERLLLSPGVYVPVHELALDVWKNENTEKNTIQKAAGKLRSELTKAGITQLVVDGSKIPNHYTLKLV